MVTSCDVALRANILSICTGGGGLDLGVRLACPDTLTVCYVEREAFAVANLGAAIEAGLMDEAPIWDDLRTFDGTAWRGAVDWLIGGIPCQPHSMAGQRLGADDERDLWPDTARIIGEVRPPVVFLENVPGILGYYHERIGPDLRAMGYRTEEGLFSAVEVGAPHVRQRFFVLAYADGPRREGPGARTEQRKAEHGACIGKGRTKLADAERSERRPHGRARGSAGSDLHEQGRQESAGRPRMGNEAVPHSGSNPGSAEPELKDQGLRHRCESKPLADGHIVDRCGQLWQGSRQLETGRSIQTVAVSDGCGWGAPEYRIQAGQSNAGGRGESKMAYAAGVRRDEVRRPTERQPARAGAPLPDAIDVEREGLRWTEQGVALKDLGCVFPPGPDDLKAWARVLAELPALEPAFCNVADGLATTGDRSHRLRLLGNGVVPLVAAHAFRTLAARAKIDAE